MSRRQVLSAAAAAAIAATAGQVLAATQTDTSGDVQSLLNDIKSLKDKFEKNKTIDIGREFGNNIGIARVTRTLNQAKGKVSKGGNVLKDKREKLVAHIVDAASEVAVSAPAGGVGMTKEKAKRANELLTQIVNDLGEFMKEN